MRNATQTPNYNDEVSKAYFKILKQTKALLATIEHEELRYTLVHSEGRQPGFNVKVDEFVNPLCYLCLVYADGETLEINFGFEAYNDGSGFGNIISQFLRLIYSLTSANSTSINIEGSVCCNEIHTDCSDLYECLEDSRIKRHRFVHIAYKPKPIKKKLRKVA
jgi:hypothetical protein